MLRSLAAAIRRAFTRTPRASGAWTARDHLLSICHGDEERAARLVASERRRAPGISEAEARRRAVERYRADNR